ncbi:T9SS type A sorting domain-containing protein [bacterium]|nr:T9SS type A sorting domain-containing protein [bacterium]
MLSNDIRKVFLPILCLLFLYLPLIHSQDWLVELTITGTGESETVLHTRFFGGAQTATDGYDAGLDIMSPPPSGANQFFTAFLIQTFPNQLQRDIRPWAYPYSNENEWQLRILNTFQLGSEQQISIQWIPDQLPKHGNFRIGSVDMRQNISMTFCGDSILSIRYTPSAVIYTLNMQVEPSGSGVLIPPEGDHWCNPGIVVPLMADANPGYRFKEWSGNVADPSMDSTNIKVSADETVIAYFEEINPDIELSAEELNFGSIHAQSDTCLTLKVSNTGDDTLVLSACSLAGNTPDVFILESFELPIMILPGSETVFEICFHPNGEEGVKQAGLEIYSNDPDETPVTVSLTGSGFKFYYHLTMACHPDSGGSTLPQKGDHVFVEDTLVTVTAVPNERFRFIGWEGAVSHSDSLQTDIFMDEDKQVTAQFEMITHTLDLSCRPEESGSVVPDAGSHIYPMGTKVDLTAMPAPGYSFLKWQGPVADSLLSETTTIMDSSCQVIAWFGRISHQVTIFSQPEAGGTTCPVPGDTVMFWGDTLAMTALPAEGYRFDHWSGLVLSPLNSHTSVVILSDVSVTAHFSLLPPDSVSIRLFADPSEGGIIQPVTGDTVLAMGDTLSITALPYTDFKFLRWTGPVHDPDSVNTWLLANQNMNITAQFIPDRVTLSIDIEPPGSGIVLSSTGDTLAVRGDTLMIKAIPNTGYQFSHWLGPVLAQDSITSVIMDSSLLITAIFQELSVSHFELYQVPEQFKLLQNYPNPFNPYTKIAYELPEPTHVNLIVQNIQGKQVLVLIDENKLAGRYEIVFRPCNLSSGIYILSLKTAKNNLTRKVILIQ